MPQYDFGAINENETDGFELADNLEGFRDAVQSSNEGSGRPSYAVIGTQWFDTSVTPHVLKIFDGNEDISIGLFSPSSHTFVPFYAGVSAAEGMVMAKATPAQAVAGEDNTSIMTPELVKTAINVFASVGQGQCRVDFTSATSITLSRFDGSKLVLWDGSNWTPLSITAAGLVYNLGALAADTLYYLYAYNSSNAVNLIASTDAPIDDTDSGYKVRPGANKELCVGMFYTNASSQLDDEFMVASYFNRKDRTKISFLTANASSSSGAYVEVSPDMRTPFLVWDGDDARFDMTLMQFINAASIVAEYVPVCDGLTVGAKIGSLYWDVNDAYASPDLAHLYGAIRGKAEGYHYASCLYAIDPSYIISVHGNSARQSHISITSRG